MKLNRKAKEAFVLPVLSDDPETAVPLGEALRHLQTHDPALFAELGVDPVALEIGVQIKQARIRAGLTQKQLAEASGIPQGAISDIERGKGKDGPSYRTVKALADAAGADLALNPRDGEPETAPQEEPVLHKVGNGGTLTLTDIVVGSGVLLAPALKSILPELAMKTLAAKIRAVLLAAPGRESLPVPRGRSELWELEAHGRAKVKVSEPSIVFIIDGPAVVTGRDILSDRVAFATVAEAIQLANTGGTSAQVAAVPVNAPFLREAVGA
ncbi:helix-turn-helix domain-containing protein [Sandaracinobacter sp. RS1-74]|uniref:helix-turn-helix domain-containing protein n=1 Tax=Sandaracinobacteroides sayramensis TaxID=2913411 RepID=UPI001EDC6680|nr:helix-turn-helix domain-containing protein [Sandaracinobacteroides sayramensis]MCG2841211.1 helix-turn-helix domain-containing protein [Sandaracinobacteroides sayramensis]